MHTHLAADRCDQLLRIEAQSVLKYQVHFLDVRNLA